MTLLSTLTLKVLHIYKPKNPPNNQPFAHRRYICFNGSNTNTGKMSLNLFILSFPPYALHPIQLSQVSLWSWVLYHFLLCRSILNHEQARAVYKQSCATSLFHLLPLLSILLYANISYQSVATIFHLPVSKLNSLWFSFYLYALGMQMLSKSLTILIQSNNHILIFLNFISLSSQQNIL